MSTSITRRRRTATWLCAAQPSSRRAHVRALPRAVPTTLSARTRTSCDCTSKVKFFLINQDASTLLKELWSAPQVVRALTSAAVVYAVVRRKQQEYHLNGTSATHSPPTCGCTSLKGDKSQQWAMLLFAMWVSHKGKLCGEGHNLCCASDSHQGRHPSDDHGGTRCGVAPEDEAIYVRRRPRVSPV